MRRAARGLGGETSGEAEIVLRLGRLRTSHASVLGRGPSANLGLLEPGEDSSVQA